MLIPCKSAGLDWLTVAAILRHRPLPQPIRERSLWQADLDYGRLSRETAQRTVRFWQFHNRIEKTESAGGVRRYRRLGSRMWLSSQPLASSRS